MKIFILVCLILINTWGQGISQSVPEETQHATCNVITKDVEASAKATVTRQLKGICSASDLKKYFSQLQENLLRELQEIKMSLGIKQSQYYMNKNFDLSPNSIKTTAASDLVPSSSSSSYVYDDYFDDYDQIKPKTYQKVYIPENLDENIAIYNDTVVETSDGDLYFYYWKISDINRVLKKRDIYISSPCFSVLGHNLYMHFYPNYRSEYIGLVLKPESNSFLKKHQIIFIGQTSTENQISSKILYGSKNEEKMFKIEPQMLNSNFIVNDSLLIKLKVYLNS